MTPASSLTPELYAAQLLRDLDMADTGLIAADSRCAEELWALSGAMWLSGHPQHPPRACPAPLAACAQGVWLALASLFPSHLNVAFDACRLLGERAAIAGLERNGRRSAGGSCRLLEVADGTLALNLSREADWELLPAWLQQQQVTESSLAEQLLEYPLAELVDRAHVLGLAAAALQPPPAVGGWYQRHAVGRPVAAGRVAPLVLDLSALWAGPLCGQLLAQCGARVIKVESLSRPDGARSGPQDFFHLMNTGKESVALELRSGSGRRQLLALLQAADIVIESSRPRALEQMGIDAQALVRDNPGKVWLSLTGYGRQSPMREWIAYGDDAGIAAGLGWLMGGDRGDPVFAGDAIADPLSGLHAALLAAASWRRGGGELLDVPLVSVVAHCAARRGRSESPAAIDFPPALPQARPAANPAVELGADTDRVLAEFGG